MENIDRIESIVVAGGGTGGHLFPGLAIAEEFRRRDLEIRILYVGVRGKLEEQVVPATGITFLGLGVTGLRGHGPVGVLRGIWRSAKALAQSRRVLAQFDPDLMIGVGGYASGPAVCAAVTLGIPVVLQEQNTVPGVTNRMLARAAKRVFVAFDEAAGFFQKEKVVVTGNPIRGEALGDPDDVGTGGRLKVLVLGGSRGSAGVNHLVMNTLGRLAGATADLEFVHQCGTEERALVEKAYHEAGIRAGVRTFVYGMKEVYEWSDIVISRAGAGAVSELAACGRPSVLIPFPHAAGDHQRKNAAWLAQRGGARVVEEGPDAEEVLAKLLLEFVRNRETLKIMARHSREAGKREAARVIVSECYGLLGIQGG